MGFVMCLGSPSYGHAMNFSPHISSASDIKEPAMDGQ